MNKEITMSLCEYESLLQEIKNKDAYIQKNINEGKVVIATPVKILVNMRYQGINYLYFNNLAVDTLMDDFNCNSFECIGDIEDYNNKEFERAISELSTFKGEYNEKLRHLKSTHVEKKSIKNTSFISRLLFLFGGELKVGK